MSQVLESSRRFGCSVMGRTSRVALAAVVGLAGLALGGVKITHAAEKPPEMRSQLGGYLAARLARGQFDSQAAASFYSSVLSHDQKNDQLATQAFEMEAMEANWPRAEVLAADLLQSVPTHRMARMLLGLKDFKAGKLDSANVHFQASADNPVGELTALLARGWVRVAEGKTKEALELLDTTKMPDWASTLVRYHRALMADVGGRRQEARTTYDRMFAGDQRSLRSTLAFASHLAAGGDAKGAQKLLQTYLDKQRGEGHPTARALLTQIAAGDKPTFLITTASQGLAEAFFGLGEALAGEGGVGPGVLFLQYALYLEPSFPFALAALANVYENTKSYERAIEVYDRITPGTPFETAVDIRKAFNLNQLEKVDEAKSLLEKVSERDPTDLRPLDALGSIMRGHKRFDEAVQYYSRAIQLIGKPDAKHWNYFYARGTSYERIKRWPLAEADLQTALKLSPDQPTVLNYLGYSWVDQGKNLKQALGYIEKAVKLKPDDGYIVDSLGWAHYRLGNFKDAVKWLERAVELRPDDPVLNDHLGDAFWRAGRLDEARFQWEQALTLKPEAEDSEKITKKLQKGLPALAKVPTPKRTRDAQRSDQPKRRAETAPNSVLPLPQAQ
ncbi:MAG: tetratricopeptide repeat protein [Hyphomicrobiaceae bacterium]